MKSDDVVRPFSLDTYKKRRSKLMKNLASFEKDFICLFWSGSELVRNYDSHFPFRAHSNFLYLSGFAEPETMIILERHQGKERSIIALRPRDLSSNRGSEIWEGERVGVERAPRMLGFDEAVSIDQIEVYLKERMKNHRNVFWEFGEFKAWDEKLVQISRSIRDFRRTGGFIRRWGDPAEVIHELRKQKSPEELKLMRQSAEIAAQGHIRAMEMIRPGMYEFEVAAETERVFKRAGADAPAYNTISATGNNACTLHYTSSQKRIKNGELLLMDAGAEYRGYASDITRSFPANGKFSEAQKEVYEWVLKSQMAAIRAVRPGVPWNKPHLEAVKVIAQGLRAMKILKEPVAKILKQGLWSRYMPHGTSHWLGLDVHDCGSYSDDKGKALKLKVGNVLTIEPGLYFQEDDKRVPKKYRGIGIRIEDDVAVVAGGHEVLSESCPKTIKEIESLRAPRL